MGSHRPAVVVAAFLLAASFSPQTATAADGLSAIGSFQIPTAVAIDGAGDLWVASDNVTSALLTHLRPDGGVLGQVSHGDMTSLGEGTALVADPTNGLIVMLATDGRIDLLDPASGTISPWLALRSVPTDTSAIHELVSGTVTLIPTVLPSAAVYGDLAMWRHDGQLDLFVSGVSEVIPFVTRVRIGSDGSASAKVLVASLATAAPAINEARGLTVTPAGVVVTTLPQRARYGDENVDQVVAFGALFDEGNGGAPAALLNGDAISAVGMDTDASGRVLMAVGHLGPAWCASVPAVLRLESDLSTAECAAVGTLFAEPADPAVTSDGTVVYLPMSGSGELWRIPLDG